MPVPDPTVNELVATLSRSQLPTIIVEGKDDMRIYRWVEQRVGPQNANVLPTGGRNTLLKLYDRRNEFPELPVAFVADRDLWLFSGIPGVYCGIVWTRGYSIENDLYAGANLENLLDPHEVDAHKKVLNVIIEWFAFEVGAFLEGRESRVDLSCNQVVPPAKTEMDQDFSTRRGFRCPNVQLFQQIRDEYQLKLSGSVFLRYWSVF